jgi:hypothetical protein
MMDWLRSGQISEEFISQIRASVVRYQLDGESLELGPEMLMELLDVKEGAEQDGDAKRFKSMLEAVKHEEDEERAKCVAEEERVTQKRDFKPYKDEPSDAVDVVKWYHLKTQCGVHRACSSIFRPHQHTRLAMMYLTQKHFVIC